MHMWEKYKRKQTNDHHKNQHSDDLYGECDSKETHRGLLTFRSCPVF